MYKTVRVALLLSCGVLSFSASATDEYDRSAVSLPFLQWADRYAAGSPEQQTGMLEEGVQLARQRQTALKSLMRSNPQEALRQAMSRESLAALPDDVQQLSERHIEGVADSSLFTANAPLTANSRDLLIKGALYRAHVYGNLAQRPVFRQTPVRGIAIGGEAALADDGLLPERSPAEATELVHGTWTRALTFDPTDLRIIRANGFDYIELEGCNLPEDEPGSPALPVYFFEILLPPGAVAITSRIMAVEQTIAENILPAPLQPPVPRSESLPDPTIPLAAIYQGTTPYPEESGRPDAMNRVRGCSLLPMRLHPLRYQPDKQELTMAESITVEVDYALPIHPPLQSASAGNVFATMAREMAINPDEVEAAPADNPSLLDDPGGDPVCDYLVITKASLTNAFSELAQYRIAHNGFNVEVLSVEWIDANYDGTRPDGGSDIQTKIRNCIRDYVQTRATEYVVLGGDNTIVVDRDCYVSCGSYISSNMPTDLYYAGLDGNWDDVDADGVYGEANADLINDEGDLGADVFVGRIPIRTAQQVTNYVNKVIAYETNPPYDLTRRFIMGGVKLWHSYTNTERPTDDMFDGHLAFRDDAHPRVSDAEMWARRTFRDCVQTYGWPATRIGCAFDTLTSWDTDSGGDYPAAATNLKARFNEGWSILIFDTHGGSTTWSAEGSSFSSSYAQSMTGLCAIVYTMACNTGGFDTADPSLSEGFLRSIIGGALVYFGCSRYGWGSTDPPPANSYSTGGTSAAYMRKFLQLIFQSGYLNAADVFYRHKSAYASSSGANGSYRWVQFGLNFQGDPAIDFIISAPSITVETPTPSLFESSADPFIIRVTRNNPVGELTVQYATSGSADPDADFISTPMLTGNPGCVTLPDGTGETIIELYPLDDNLPENREHLEFQITACDRYTTAVSTASIILEEDDTDGDGMPDDWETFHSLDPLEPDADHDTDGDEYNDYEEYVAGTDPADAASQFVMGRYLHQEDGPVLLLTTEEGRSYTIEYRDSLNDEAAWQTLESDISGTGEPMEITLDGTDSQRFYRLGIQLSP